MRRFREAVAVESCRAAAREVESWGYPRPVDEDEIEHGYWFRWGAGVWLWFAWADHGSRSMLVHLCVSAEHRRQVYPRRFLVGLEVLAESLGAERLVYCSAAEGMDGFDGRAMSDYVQRLGWKQASESVWIRTLEDEDGPARCASEADSGAQGEDGGP